MILFQTILDPNEVFFPQNSNKIPPNQIKRVENCILYGVKYKKGFQVNGVFSTNPEDYLNPRYQVGSIL